MSHRPTGPVQGGRDPVRSSGPSAPKLRSHSLTLHYLGLGFAALLLPAAAAAIKVKPDFRTFVAASLYIAALAWAAWQPHYRKKQAAKLASVAPNSADAELLATRAELKKADSWMRLFPIGLVLAGFLKFSALTDFTLDDFIPGVFRLARTGQDALWVFVILLCVMAYFMRRSLVFQRKLKRLEAMQSPGIDRAEA